MVVDEFRDREDVRGECKSFINHPYAVKLTTRQTYKSASGFLNIRKVRLDKRSSQAEGIGAESEQGQGSRAAGSGKLIGPIKDPKPPHSYTRW